MRSRCGRCRSPDPGRAPARDGETRTGVPTRVTVPVRSQRGPCGRTSALRRRLMRPEDDRHGRGADAEEVRLWVVDVDAHGEALCDVDPVELATDGGNAGRDVSVLRIHRPA